MVRIISRALLTLFLLTSSTAWASTITAKHSGKVLDVPGWNPGLGVQIIQWTANWGPNQYFDVNDEGSGYYTIFNPMTRQCLDAAFDSRGNGTPIVQWWCHKHDNQLWRLDRGSDGYVRFINKHSGKCMTVAGGSRDDGAGLIQWDCSNLDEQRFRF